MVSSSKTQYYCKIDCDNDLRTLNLLCYTFEFPFQCFLTLSVAKDIIRSLSRCNVLTFVIENSLFSFKNTQHRWIYILVSKTKFSQKSSMGIYTGGNIYWRTTVIPSPFRQEWSDLLENLKLERTRWVHGLKKKL